MQIRATKVFAKELNKRVKNNYCIESINLIKVPHDRAYLLIGDGYSDQDIDFDDWTVKCLQITYKPNCYAMPRYVTTGDLNRLCRHADGLTIEKYMEMFLDEYEI